MERPGPFVAIEIHEKTRNEEAILYHLVAGSFCEVPQAGFHARNGERI